MSHQTAFETFLDPPREFGLIPFWFWNDDLQEEELIRQLREFNDAGFGGVMPHARIGLSRRVGYLTDEYFRLVRLVVDEAARLGMKVILYDEASYPSGSANGAVVAENAEYASQSIRLWEEDIEGPHKEYLRPNTGRALLDKHVCTILGKVDAGGVIDPVTLEVLEPHDNTIFKIEVGSGHWKVMSVWNTASGGTVRGAFPESEDAHAMAPAAGDILNPEAVACFIRLTHDRYYEELKEHFGKTVIAMFTDEPNVTGRGARPRGKHKAQPFTPGFVEWITQLWGEDPTMWLPALWMDYGPETEAFRHRYEEAVQTRLQEVFYAGQSEWCETHGIELTGHPAESNELTALRLFQLPGQDMVWRYIEPNKGTGIQGEHSVAAKAATSGARLSNRRRILTEVCGAYGWQLSLDEIKWLFDWHMVRGNNLVNVHAVFYSIRDRRAWESEPDLAIHNVWWPYFKDIAMYTRRLCWMLADGEHICNVAILGDGNRLPWGAARHLYEAQIDFLYVDDRAVAVSTLVAGRMVVGAQEYEIVVIDTLPSLSDEARVKLDAFQAAGGKVIDFREGMPLVSEIAAAVSLDIRISPPDPNLRFTHYRKEGLDLYLLVNEGEEAIVSDCLLSSKGSTELWDPLSGDRLDARITEVGDGLSVGVELGRRESLVIAVDPASSASSSESLSYKEQSKSIEVEWSVHNSDGRPVSIDGLGDWAQQEPWELFSGTITYRAEIELPEADEIILELGKVGDIAEVLVDGSSVGARMWAPHNIHFKGTAGMHSVEVRVTNSMANSYEGMQLPSGLMGPVNLVARHLQ